MSEIMLVPLPLASSKLLISFLIFQISTFRSALVSSQLMLLQATFLTRTKEVKTSAARFVGFRSCKIDVRKIDDPEKKTTSLCKQHSYVNLRNQQQIQNSFDGFSHDQRFSVFCLELSLVPVYDTGGALFASIFASLDVIRWERPDNTHFSRFLDDLPQASNMTLPDHS